MAQGKLVVTTPVGAEGMPDDIGSCMLIADDAAGFASHVNRALTNRSEAESLAAKGKEFVIHHFDNRNITTQLTEFYQSLLS